MIHSSIVSVIFFILALKICSSKLSFGKPFLSLTLSLITVCTCLECCFVLSGLFDFTCELDEYAFLKKELQESGIIKDIRSGLKTYKNSFYGRDAVSFLVQAKNLGRALFSLCFVSFITARRAFDSPEITLYDFSFLNNECIRFKSGKTKKHLRNTGRLSFKCKLERNCSCNEISY